MGICVFILFYCSHAKVKQTFFKGNGMEIHSGQTPNSTSSKKVGLKSGQQFNLDCILCSVQHCNRSLPCLGCQPQTDQSVRTPTGPMRVTMMNGDKLTCFASTSCDRIKQSYVLNTVVIKITFVMGKKRMEKEETED